jgi:ApaG protein
MADSPSQLAPLSDSVTRNIRVEVMARYSAENSQPGQGKWVFQYTVRITNQGSETVQLMTRHWIITDAIDHVSEVKGEGVIGHQPVLAPGESFKYSSWWQLSDGQRGRERVRCRDRSFCLARAVHRELNLAERASLRSRLKWSAFAIVETISFY